jgi:hypothetical protein
MAKNNSKEEDKVPSTEDMKEDSDSSNSGGVDKKVLKEVIKEVNLEERLKWKVENCSEEECRMIIKLAEQRIEDLQSGKTKCDCDPSGTLSKY